MLRLHEFITIIRNCKTIAEERAEYQKEMAAIRESFAKNQETLRPRNVTKLLFINMSGQQTNFGQMECLKLITANSLIQKRIGYLGLTQLFHEKSQLLMMATNRLRVDLGCMNNNIVGLVLCVLSQICTTQLARQLHNQVLKCISNNSSYIRKKAILTSIKLIKKCPQYIAQFLPKIASCLQQKNHGVLLSCMAFIQNVLTLDQAHIQDIVNLVPRIAKVYKLIANQHNAEYQIGGVQDPFLQVSILRLLRMLRKYNNSFDKVFGQVLVVCHDSVCSKVSNNLKNGANSVLFEAFQCFMILQPTNQMRQCVSNVLSKFISVKDANSKYLSLFNLSLMTKFDLKIVKSHKGTIFQCLNQNDILIRIMALDLLYVIASADNANSIVKQLLNTLLGATDEEFIAQLALKICLIVQKHSQSRRWHFDTILKVLILADQSVKEQSAKSLIHLITSTPQLQEYCMAKLFFSTTENLQNDALAKICLYLLGELVQVLLRMNGIQIDQTNVLDLIESIIFRGGVAYDTIAYGLSALLKLFQKFPGQKERITKMIKSFVTHSDLQVQKRACEYTILIEPEWDDDRKKQVCIPVPPFRQTAQAFRNIPIGETQLDLDLTSVKMPGKPNVNYDQHISKEIPVTEGRQVQINRGPQQVKQAEVIKQQSFKKKNTDNIFDDIMNDPTPVQQLPKQVQKKQSGTLMDDDDIFNSITGGNDQKTTGNLGGLDLGFNLGGNTQPQQTNNDMFGMLNLNLGGNTNPISPQNNGFGGDLLGFGNTQPIKTNNNANNLLGGGDLLGFGGQGQPQNNGFNMNQKNNMQQNLQQAPKQQAQNANKILAYENSQMQIWMNCQKETHDTTKIVTTYTNKTQSSIQNITIQAAVMKHLKLTINPLSSTTLGPLAKQSINQIMTVVNSAVGEKGIVMKMKLSYKINGQKLDFQQKIANFPAGM